MKVPKLRVVPRHEDSLRSLVEGADHAEAFVDQLIERASPVVQRVHAYRTRVATIAVAVVAVWLFLHVTFGANGMVVYRGKRAEYQDLQKDIDRLQKENAQYTQQVDELKTDPKRIEREAREQFHYARPGEVIYVAPERPSVPAHQVSRSARK